MNKLVIFLGSIGLLILASCEPNNACLSSQPTETTPWLKAIKDTMDNCPCEKAIVKGAYNGQTVFFVTITDNAIECANLDEPLLWNCEGDSIRKFTSIDYADFENLVTKDTYLYTCN